MSRSIPKNRDSIDKLLHRLSLVAKVPITKDHKPVSIEPPTHIYLSPSLLREFRCHVGCTACCLPFSLDFLHEEILEFSSYWNRDHLESDSTRWSTEIDAQARSVFTDRRVEVNGTSLTIWSYPQYLDDKCPFLRPTREGGALGCSFWTSDNSTQPLECAAAPQLLISTRGNRHPGTVLSKRPFGRASQWQVVPECEFDPILDNLDQIPVDYYPRIQNEIMLLERYQLWANAFKIDTWVPQIVNALKWLPFHLQTEGLHLVEVKLE